MTENIINISFSNNSIFGTMIKFLPFDFLYLSYRAPSVRFKMPFTVLKYLD